MERKLHAPAERVLRTGSTTEGQVSVIGTKMTEGKTEIEGTSMIETETEIGRGDHIVVEAETEHRIDIERKRRTRGDPNRVLGPHLDEIIETERRKGLEAEKEWIVREKGAEREIINRAEEVVALLEDQNAPNLLEQMATDLLRIKKSRPVILVEVLPSLHQENNSGWKLQRKKRSLLAGLIRTWT